MFTITSTNLTLYRTTYQQNALPFAPKHPSFLTSHSYLSSLISITCCHFSAPGLLSLFCPPLSASHISNAVENHCRGMRPSNSMVYRVISLTGKPRDVTPIGQRQKQRHRKGSPVLSSVLGICTKKRSKNLRTVRSKKALITSLLRVCPIPQTTLSTLIILWNSVSLLTVGDRYIHVVSLDKTDRYR